MFSFEVLYPFLMLHLKMGSGVSHFSFSFQLQICRGLLELALWALGLCLLAKTSVSGAFQHLPGVSWITDEDCANQPVLTGDSGLSSHAVF